MKPDTKVSGPGTVIGSSVTLTGILKDNGDITVHGHVDGEVHSDRMVIVGEAAEIIGPVTGQVITVAGRIKGSVEADQKLEILSSGKIFGSISTRELIVRPGAIFVGKSTMPFEEEETTEETTETHAFDDDVRAVDMVREISARAENE